ncbi:probable galacturonosyltransferase 15 [Mangifera indica]|uniref:probable galacturonosyltransferase 15 n=1 Tax=Mangifera indica TaxID=29780 RepID=UPI001CFAABC9|nr:probable galacturonosyltransferase 15 [Mangifera indica]
MKFYISTTGINRVTISNSSKGSLAAPALTLASRRISTSRALLPVVLVLGIVLPLCFVRVAFLVLESTSICSSSLDCIGRRLFSGSDTSLGLREELTRALLEANDGTSNDGVHVPLESFNELVKEMTSKQQDIKAFASKTKAMLLGMERKVQSARQRESIYWHLASHGIPKSTHCLCLKLAEEYAVNAVARSRLPSPEYVSHLTDPSFRHVVLLTDNVLAASVVVSSTVQNFARPEELVFHIVTDRKTFTPMHAWFAINSVKSAVVEVKGLHQYDWSQEVNVGVKEMLEINRLVWSHFYNNLKQEDFEYREEHRRYLEVLSPSCLSLMNHLRIYIHELFPDLNKVVLLEDDIVVQHDISSLWELDLEGKAVGAVFGSSCGDNCCVGRRFGDYLNFSNPVISSNFDPNRSAWLFGMNVLDLEAWRKSDVTATYHKWLKLNLNSGLTLWKPGVLPPALLTLEGNVHPIDPSWHVAGLGHRSPEACREMLNSAAVLHFSGPAKPWLEIGFPEVRSLWYRHVNFSNRFIRKCRIMG